MRFFVRVFIIVVFFVGLGGIAEKVNFYFQPEDKETVSLTEAQAPEVRIVKLAPLNKIVVRRIQIANPEECRMKIGPVMPSRFEQKFEMVREPKIEQ